LLFAIIIPLIWILALSLRGAKSIEINRNQ